MTERIPHGSSSLHLVSGVSYLNMPEAVFEAIIEGWRAQQIGGRNLQVQSASSSIVIASSTAIATNNSIYAAAVIDRLEAPPPLLPR